MGYQSEDATESTAIDQNARQKPGGTLHRSADQFRLGSLPGHLVHVLLKGVRVPVERDHRFWWKMIIESGGR